MSDEIDGADVAALKRENPHWTDIDTNAAVNTGAVAVVEGQLILSVGHDVDSNLAIGRAQGAGDALVVGDNLQLAKILG